MKGRTSPFENLKALVTARKPVGPTKTKARDETGGMKAAAPTSVGAAEVEVEVAEAAEEGRPPMLAPHDLLHRTRSLNNEEVPVGGRLALFKDQWKFCPWAYSIVSKGLGWKWRSKPPKLRRFFQPSTPFLEEYVEELLSKRVIRPVKAIKFQGRLFCVPKKDSAKLRTILDLSVLNKDIVCDKFHLLTIAQIRTLLPKGPYAFSIVAHHFSPYLGFALGHKAYAFRTMPFGQNFAPRIFTKLAEAMLQFLRNQGA